MPPPRWLTPARNTSRAGLWEQADCLLLTAQVARGDRGSGDREGRCRAGRRPPPRPSPPRRARHPLATTPAPASARRRAWPARPGSRRRTPLCAGDPLPGGRRLVYRRAQRAQPRPSPSAACRRPAHGRRPGSLRRLPEAGPGRVWRTGVARSWWPLRAAASVTPAWVVGVRCRARIGQSWSGTGSASGRLAWPIVGNRVGRVRARGMTRARSSW